MHGKIIKFKGDISELDTAGYAILGLKYLGGAQGWIRFINLNISIRIADDGKQWDLIDTLVGSS